MGQQGGERLFWVLAYTPFILIGGNEAYANQIAMGASLEAHTPPRLARLVYAYYFLVIGVVQQFVEYLRENKGRQESP